MKLVSTSTAVSIKLFYKNWMNSEVLNIFLGITSQSYFWKSILHNPHS